MCVQVRELTSVCARIVLLCLEVVYSEALKKVIVFHRQVEKEEFSFEKCHP